MAGEKEKGLYEGEEEDKGDREGQGEEEALFIKGSSASMSSLLSGSD